VFESIEAYCRQVTLLNGGVHEVIKDEENAFVGCFSMFSVVVEVLQLVCHRYITLDAASTFNEGQIGGQQYFAELKTGNCNIITAAWGLFPPESDFSWGEFVRLFASGCAREGALDYVNDPRTIIAGTIHLHFHYAMAILHYAMAIACNCAC
jgi:hypothetical protein